MLQSRMWFKKFIAMFFAREPRGARNGIVAFLVMGVLIALVAVGKSCGESPRSEVLRPASTIPARSYVTRGIIEAMPAKDRPGTQFIVQHEEIPDFMGSDGRVGMKKMAMPFPLGEGVLIDGYNVGDHVVIDFTVDWNKSPAYWVTKITKAEPVEQENTEPQR